MTPVKVPYVIPGNTDYDTPINPITEMTPVKVPYVIPGNTDYDTGKSYH